MGIGASRWMRTAARMTGYYFDRSLGEGLNWNAAGKGTPSSRVETAELPLSLNSKLLILIVIFQSRKW
jgi:hypothetical protein